MGARWSLVAVIAGLTLASSTVWADQTVTLGAVEMSITIPDGWVHETQGDTDVFTRAADGGYIGALAILTSDCARVIASMQQNQAQLIAADVTPLDGWSGFEYADGGRTTGTYCRDVDIGVRYAALLSGPVDEVRPLVRSISAGIDAHRGVFEKFRLERERDPETKHDLTLLTLKIEIQAPTTWKSSYNNSYDWVSRGGQLVAKVASWAVDCRPALKARGGITSVEFPGWSKVEIDGDQGYCHESGRAWVEFEAGLVDWVLPAIGEALERRRIADMPTAFDRFGPNRYELGLGLFDPDPDDLFVESGWGVSAAVAKTPWRGESGLTWSYQARLAANGAGFPGAVEGGVGLNLKGIALQGIVGFGAAGDPAPLAAHAGGQFDLLVLPGAGGFDFSISRVWLDGGTATRMQGGFMLAGARRAYSMSFGWESRLGTSLFTINLMTMRLPTRD